jgi:PAS domain S-box-containing protein
MPLAQLRNENNELRARLAESEEVLNAIRSGEVDAFVAHGPGGEQIYTLQGAETPYRILVEEMNQGALMVIPDGTILYANARFAALSKTPLEQITGSSWRQFFSPDHHAHLEACLRPTALACPPEELKLQAADGSFCPVQLSLRAMNANAVSGFSVILTDLTERRQSENALRKTSEQLAETNKQLESFSYSISHDMRAPLRAMQGFGKILVEDYGAQFQGEPLSYLQRIIAAAEKLDSLIQNVLAYSRSTQDSNELASFDLDKIIRETIQSYPNLRAANIEHVPSGAQVRGYAVPLGQCVLNLLTNAIKFVPHERLPMVKIWTTAQNGHFRLWVQDNGIGIRAEDQAKIFEIFTRLETDEAFEGTGIGLAMVKTAVEKMGGQVGVESALGEGSRFWIDLQRA